MTLLVTPRPQYSVADILPGDLVDGSFTAYYRFGCFRYHVRCRLIEPTFTVGAFGYVITFTRCRCGCYVCVAYGCAVTFDLGLRRTRRLRVTRMGTRTRCRHHRVVYRLLPRACLPTRLLYPCALLPATCLRSLHHLHATRNITLLILVKTVHPICAHALRQRATYLPTAYIHRTYYLPICCDDARAASAAAA